MDPSGPMFPDDSPAVGQLVLRISDSQKIPRFNLQRSAQYDKASISRFGLLSGIVYFSNWQGAPKVT